MSAPRNTSTPYTPPISPDAPAGREFHLRTPPHDKDAEQAVLGGMMMAASVVDDVSEILMGGGLLRAAARDDLLCDHLLGPRRPAR